MNIQIPTKKLMNEKQHLTCDMHAKNLNRFFLAK